MVDAPTATAGAIGGDVTDAEIEAVARRLDAEHPDAGVIKERVEQADGV